MWPFKTKIKEEPKRYPYGRRYESSNYSVWDNMSMIEKFAMIFLPCILCGMFYIMLEMTGLIWWIRLLISIGIVSIIIIVITLLVSWFTGGDW
jgi:hypothetical protein